MHVCIHVCVCVCVDVVNVVKFISKYKDML